VTRKTLRPYQEDAVAAHFTWFEQHRDGNPMLVVPTGAGKSLIIAEFVRYSLERWPDCRFLVLTHVRELIQQNHDEFVGHWGGAVHPAGIYSAGLGRRDARARVLFAGIQSVYQRAADLGSFDLVLVDEAHLIPKRGQGRYLTYFAALREINPRARVVGYTATPFRLDGGWLHKGDGCLFDAVAYEVRLEQLVRDGYLVPLVSRLPGVTIDVSGCRSEGGDFKVADLERAATAEGVVEAAVEETVAVGRAAGRRAWIVFGTTVNHAELIREQLELRGVRAECVFGSTTRAERDDRVRRFRDGELPCIVNVGVLTTGFNAPRADLIAMMRPTQSAALYVQVMGRGMRTFPGKRDCLVLDFGDNVRRHGPVNRVRPRSAGGGSDGPLARACPMCSTLTDLGAAECPACGHEFTRACPLCGAQVPVRERECSACGYAWVGAPHGASSSDALPYDPDADQPRVLEVRDLAMSRHHNYKVGGRDSVRVDYLCGMRTISEWVCPEHEGFAGRKAARWWSAMRGRAPTPRTVEEMLERRGEVSRPDAIEVVPDGDFDRVARPLFRRYSQA